MKAKWLLSVSTVVAAVSGLASHAADMGTAFTYQGFLENGTGPVTATCDFRLGLWDAPTGGSEKGASPQTVNLVDVENGVFTATIDFGPGATDGTARWLAIEVQCPGDSGFTMLTPRVELTPTPYSIRAGKGVGGPNALNVTAAGAVGIGTASPSSLHQLHVYKPGQRSALLEINAPGDGQVLTLKNADPTGDAAIDFYSGGSYAGNIGLIRQYPPDRFFILSNNPSNLNLTLVENGGNVGIGTTTPAARLDVNGAARTTTLEITGGTPPQSMLAGWGNNAEGEINFPFFDTFTVIAACSNHSLAIHSDGTLAGWGSNNDGQIDVPAGTFVTVAAGESYGVAIRSDGTLAQWGANPGTLPAGTFIAIAAASTYALAIRSDGTIIGWGSNTYNPGNQINPPGGTFMAIASGSYHSLAIRTDGTLVGWGSNNTYGEITVPPGTFVAVAARGYQSLAIRSDGTVVGWGRNLEGQANVPTGTFTGVAAGGYHGVAVRDDGTLVGWGHNGGGQIDVPSGTFIAVAAGNSHSLAIRSNPPSPDPALRLHFDSAFKPGTNTWTIFSDRRLKKNIEPLSGALERLLQLRGVTFQWIDPSSQGGITGTQMGLIADEVSRAFPQWVGRDPKGYQTLTVGGFEALTAEALRELRAEKDQELDQMRAEKDCLLAELREKESVEDQRISELEARLAATEALLARFSNANNEGAR